MVGYTHIYQTPQPTNPAKHTQPTNPPKPTTAENPTYAPVAAKLQFRWPAPNAARTGSTNNDDDEDEEGGGGVVYWESAEAMVERKMTVRMRMRVHFDGRTASPPVSPKIKSHTYVYT